DPPQLVQRARELDRRRGAGREALLQRRQGVAGIEGRGEQDRPGRPVQQRPVHVEDVRPHSRASRAAVAGNRSGGAPAGSIQAKSPNLSGSSSRGAASAAATPRRPSTPATSQSATSTQPNVRTA